MKTLRVCSIILTTGALALAASGPIFTNIPGTLPTEFASSFGFDANSVIEFGGILQPNLSGGDYLTSGTVVLQNLATESVYDPSGLSPTGYSVPLTLTLYDVNSDGSVGSAFATSTLDPTIAWATQNCSEVSNGTTSPAPCDVQAVQFSFAGQTVPSEFIWGLSFATDYSTSSGLSSDPTDSLNLALTEDPTLGFIPATVGTDLAYSCAGGPPTSDPSTDYCETVYYADNSDAYQQFQGFTPGQGTGVVEFDATNVAPTPEPATFGLIGLGLIGLSLGARRKNRG